MLEAPLVTPVLRAAPQAKLARPEALQVRPVPQVASPEKPVRLEQVDGGLGGLGTAGVVAGVAGAVGIAVAVAANASSNNNKAASP